MKIDVLVPDLGSDDAFPVIEVIAAVGDDLANEDPIIVLESDKATMEVPVTQPGKLVELKVGVGDKVKTGDVVAVIEGEGGEAKAAEKPAVTTAEPAPATTEKAQPASEAPAVAPAKLPPAELPKDADIYCEMLVIGSGPGGYSAAFRSADLGMKTVLVEKYETLGGVCLNVGCIPSKALLHATAVIDESAHIKSAGISFTKPKVDLNKLRAHKDEVVGRLTKGVAGMAKGRKVEVVTGVGEFNSANSMVVKTADGEKTIAFERAIIAVGSRPIKLPFVPEDPRIIDSTGALELADIPKHMLIIGGGIIGMEMATVYSTLGAEISVVELSKGLMPGADDDLRKVWTKANESRFKEILLETKVVDVKADKKGIHVTFEGKVNETKTYDKVLLSVGRVPNGKNVGAENAGVNVDERGFIAVDKQMRTNVPHIFAIGDVVGQPMLAHKAVHEAHVAAEAAYGEKSFFDARVIPSVAYTTPEIAFAGLTETQAKAEKIPHEVAKFPWAASGKAIANGVDNGFTKLIFDPETNRLLGGAVVGANAGDLIGEICLAVEMDADATDIGKTIHPHPTLGESIGMTAELYSGHCTDLPPQRKRK